MRPEYYADFIAVIPLIVVTMMAITLFKIASGASDYDYNWTEVLMKNVGHRMAGFFTLLYSDGMEEAKDRLHSSLMMIIIGLWARLEIEPVLKKHMANYG